MVTNEQEKTGAAGADPELSIVLPCLDEIITLAAALEMAKAAIDASGLRGEVIVADNGSTDGSQALAERLGARVVPVDRRGYGFALMAGCRAARGQWIIMGDADATYDFREAVAFLEDLRNGADLVMGSRLRGRIHSGAMPFLHRHLGTPVLSRLIRGFFRVPISDCNCGMRAFTKAAFEKLQLVSGGMEFASEMIIKAGIYGLKVTERPCSLLPDRRGKPPHLRRWRDGWRHLRFILLFAPHVIFEIPGWALLLIGSAVTIPVLAGPFEVAGRLIDYHYLFYSIPLIFIGYQALWFDKVEEYYVHFAGYLPVELRRRQLSRFNLEGWLILGSAAALVGTGILVALVVKWAASNFGQLHQLRLGAAAMLLLITGVQTVMNAMVISMMDIKVDRRT